MTSYLFGSPSVAKTAVVEVTKPAAASPAAGKTADGRVVTILNKAKDNAFYYGKKVPGVERTINAAAPYATMKTATYVLAYGCGIVSMLGIQMMQQPPEQKSSWTWFN